MYFAIAVEGANTDCGLCAGLRQATHQMTALSFQHVYKCVYDVHVLLFAWVRLVVFCILLFYYHHAICLRVVMDLMSAFLSSPPHSSLNIGIRGGRNGGGGTERFC